MSEQLHNSHEQKGEVINTELESHHNLERLKQEAQFAESEGHQSVEQLHHIAKEEAISSKDTTVGEKEHTNQQSPFAVHKQLKTDSYRRTIQKVRQHLNPAERTLSRIMHKPSVESLSNVGATTVARPSGVLGGGIVSLSGSFILLYMAKHYGFRYNFLVFFLLFIAGFTIGVIGEILVRLLWRRRHYA